MSEHYCNNCGKQGHLYNQCKMPITSLGVIAYRYNANKCIEYLMIRRKDTLGFIDFMRGKYFVNNKFYILNMLNQMTVHEKERLKTMDFDELWYGIWGDCKISGQYKHEEHISKNKFNSLRNGVYYLTEPYNLNQLIEESNDFGKWTEPEWGFPKGRRNYQENDYACALREFSEETGIKQPNLILVQNIIPYEETFPGSNYKSYKHKYFLNFVKNHPSINLNNYEKSEVSCMEWKTYDECVQCIRPYNLEKLSMLKKINHTLTHYQITFCN